MSKPTTPCHICGKKFINLSSHHTKMHRVTETTFDGVFKRTYSDGVIVFEQNICGPEWTQLLEWSKEQIPQKSLIITPREGEKCLEVVIGDYKQRWKDTDPIPAHLAPKPRRVLKSRR